MKKIYFIVSLALLAIFTSCEDFNSKNFSDLDLNADPQNVISYNYDVTSADYTTIANLIKKPVTDSIAAQKVLLSKAKNAPDSLVINNLISALNLRLSSIPLYANATKIDQTKSFNAVLKAKDYIPYLLAQKFPYADANSSVKVSYDLVDAADTSSIAAANKFVISDAEYTQMGVSTNQPGKSLYFSPAMNIMYYLNTYLKSKCPYAPNNEVRMVRYKYNSASTLQYRVLTFNGTDWKCATDQYSFKKGKWLDILILKGLTDGIGDFIPINVNGAQVWAWNSYKYMLMTGYVSGAYFDNEDWLISPPMNLLERVNPVFNFTHVGRYFGDSGTSKDKMKKAITIWVSTTSDATSIKTEDWTQLTFPEAGYPSGLNWTFIPSTPISLAAYAGQNNVRIAFKYMSSASDGAAGSWEVKNVLVTEE